MNETIGAKGSGNDRRRSLKISQAKKKKLRKHREEELKQLEQKVKRLQKVTLIKVLPLVVTGQVFKTLIDNSKKVSKVNKEETFSKLNIKVYDVNISNNEKEEIEEKKEKYLYEDKVEKAFSERTIEEKIVLDYKVLQKVKPKKDLNEKTKLIKKVEVKQQKQETIPLKTTTLDNSDLLKAKNKKIVSTYEAKLKEARKDLRAVYFEYKTVSNEEDEAIDKKVENVIDGLTLIIDKISTLKENIKVKNKDLLNDNYIEATIEKYIEDFKNNKDILEIKDSELYRILSQKIAEITSTKDDVSNKTVEKKNTLNLEDIDISSLKEKYYNYEKFNKMLLDFQNEQDYLLKEVREKVKNATTVEEKVKVEVETMNRQSSKLFKFLSWQMFLPGPRSAKALATMATTYLYFVNNIMKPKTTTKRYKVIKVKDYSREIESSLSAIDNISVFLGRTKAQLARTITEFKKDYADYLELPECEKLLKNLEKVKADLSEKEYEINSLQKEQKKLLEKNNAKVLKYQN